MNFDDLIKSPKSDDYNSSPTNSSSNISDNGKHATTKSHATAAAAATTIETGDDTEINLNDFLDFLKVSCHVNDMINNNFQQNRAAGGRDSSNKSTTNVDFEQLAANRVVNTLLAGGAGASSSSKTVNYEVESNDNNNINSISSSRYNNSSNVNSNANDRFRRRRTSSVGCNATHLHTPQDLGGLHRKLKSKLDYVINEGVMDSILPFICPVPLPPSYGNKLSAKLHQKSTSAATSTTTIPTKVDTVPNIAMDLPTTTAAATGATTSGDSMVKLGAGGRRKSLRAKTADKRTDTDVVIHVCDEVKHTSRDFVCAQHLLVSKMGYFADVTAGQKLEDMDISVHCDIHIFDWLMRWVKRCDSVASYADTPEPHLDATNVVPILVSASFLQMEPLLMDCLTFCHARLNEVVRGSTNLACLNDTIVTRLAAMFTNVELEWVRDKKERVTPRLWTKLIQSLCEPEPEALRGHYYSLAGLFQCSHCTKCLTNTMETYVNCQPANIRINRWGQLVSTHRRNCTWNLSTYIAQLFKEHKSWRLVYWKLWGYCHYLYCCVCEMHFPAFQMTWCRYHPEAPQFLGPVTEGRITGPAGRYPCCGQQAFRYETLPGQNGCQFREHNVVVDTDRERAILAISQLVAENGALWENPPLPLQEMIATGDLEPRWVGIALTPMRTRQGLLSMLHAEESSSRAMHRVRSRITYETDTSTDTDTSDTMSKTIKIHKRLTGARYSSSSDGCESENCNGGKHSYNKKGRKRQTSLSGRYWAGDQSARSNQDHQREYEERVMKKVMALVTRRTGSEHILPAHSAPMGGSFVRLEAEWRDNYRQRVASNVGVGNISGSSSQQNNSNMSSGSNTNMCNIKQRK